MTTVRVALFCTPENLPMEASTKFRVNCPCGDHVLVSEGAAGATFTCSCGKLIQIPSSIQLRAVAGLAPIAPPEEVVEMLLMSGTVPGDGRCSLCAGETRDIIKVLTVCERVQTKRSGGFSWPLFVFSLVFLPVKLFLWEPPEEQYFGRDKIFPLPLFVCEKCRPAVCGRAVLVRCFRRVPEYRNLLEKFPNASLEIVNK